MKKALSLLLIIAFVLPLFGCKSHVHEFVLSEADSKPASCTAAGLEVKVCSCGEKQETPIEATGHNFQVVLDTPPTCTGKGSIDSKCANCGRMQYTNVDATGHNFEEVSSEPSRVRRCLNEGCTECAWGEYESKYTDELTFKFTEEDEAAIEAKYQEVKALVEAAPKYDPELHGYAETGALAEEFAAVDALHTELYDLVMYVVSQQQLAMVAYYCDMENTELEETYSYMMDYQDNAVAQFYTLSQPFYDSCYRDFYYYGMTEEEIMAFLFDSNAISNPEYTALKERNNAIEVEFLALSSSEQKARLPELYAEFVDNNNKMAELMGYDNYLEYSYENVRSRDYTYQEAAQLAEYAKTYLAPVLVKLYQAWSGFSGVPEDVRALFQAQLSDSFFGSLSGNTLVNDYIDLMEFNSDPDRIISFSDEFNKLMSDGNMFRGDYEGAFVTTIASEKLPIAYFGKGYQDCFTVVHEFGHYMNEVYSGEIYADSDYSQSYDLLEMHSQGNELLYLCYLEEYSDYSQDALAMIRTYALVNMLYAAIAGFTIDSLEQAIYLDQYTGYGAEEIMADGTITADEYNELYNNICIDFGVQELLGGYWQYGMTITSPCYYVSYSVSAISVLQLYEVAKTEGFDTAKEQYLKLFTYVDEDPGMGVDDVLLYAGMLSFTDEQLYIQLDQYFKTNK